MGPLRALVAPGAARQAGDPPRATTPPWPGSSRPASGRAIRAPGEPGASAVEGTADSTKVRVTNTSPTAWAAGALNLTLSTVKWAPWYDGSDSAGTRLATIPLPALASSRNPRTSMSRSPCRAMHRSRGPPTRRCSGGPARGHPAAGTGRRSATPAVPDDNLRRADAATDPVATPSATPTATPTQRRPQRPRRYPARSVQGQARTDDPDADDDPDANGHAHRGSGHSGSDPGAVRLAGAEPGPDSRRTASPAPT